MLLILTVAMERMFASHALMRAAVTSRVEHCARSEGVLRHRRWLVLRRPAVQADVPFKLLSKLARWNSADSELRYMSATVRAMARNQRLQITHKQRWRTTGL